MTSGRYPKGQDKDRAVMLDDIIQPPELHTGDSMTAFLDCGCNHSFKFKGLFNGEALGDNGASAPQQHPARILLTQFERICRSGRVELE